MNLDADLQRGLAVSRNVDELEGWIILKLREKIPYRLSGPVRCAPFAATCLGQARPPPSSRTHQRPPLWDLKPLAEGSSWEPFLTREASAAPDCFSFSA